MLPRLAPASRRDGGWALIIDYSGENAQAGASSLQAVRSHQGADILDRPGETDLSAHVDFDALAQASGVAAFGPIGQGAFLRQLGHHRTWRGAEAAREASPQQARAIDAASVRLIAPDQMGTLFRVLALGDGKSAPPAGFSDHPTSVEPPPRTRHMILAKTLADLDGVQHRFFTRQRRRQRRALFRR